MTTMSTHLHIKRHNCCDLTKRLRGFSKMMLSGILRCDMCDINKITLRGVPFLFWQCVVKFEGFFFFACIHIHSLFVIASSRPNGYPSRAQTLAELWSFVTVLSRMKCQIALLRRTL